MRSHPSPEAGLAAAVEELKAAGHDLRLWETDKVWGHDSKARPGAGLRIIRITDDDGGEDTVEVVFEPPAR